MSENEDEPELKPYTVIFYEDGEYTVHTYVSYVEAEDAESAFDEAVKEEGAGPNATEIITFDGHIPTAWE